MGSLHCIMSRRTCITNLFHRVRKNRGKADEGSSKKLELKKMCECSSVPIYSGGGVVQKRKSLLF